LIKTPMAGWVGEGAGAVVLKRHNDALETNDRVYAVIDGVTVIEGPQTEDGAGSGVRPTATGVTKAARQALAAADLSPSDVGYLELYAGGISAEDEAEIIGLTEAYRTTSPGLSCAIGSAKANIGQTFASSGIAALVKTAHCLYQRYIPATPHWSGPKLPNRWENSPFYVAPQSRPWFLQADQTRRVAAINGLGADRSYAHIILSDEPAQPERANPYLTLAEPFLFPVAADNQTTLSEQLYTLRQRIEKSTSLPVAARENFDAFRHQPAASYTVAIIGPDKTALIHEIDAALNGLPVAFKTGEPWKSPAGSYFTPNPQGPTGKVTFVYPGAFSSYLGLGRDLFQLFPALHTGFSGQVPNPGELVGEQALYPRSLQALSPAKLKRHQFKLMSNSITMMQSGATYSTLVTRVLQEQFKLQPDAALGYSLGEMTMMFGLGIWSPTDNNGAELRRSPLFRNRLSGPKNAVREFWGMPPVESTAEDNRLWAIFLLKATPAEVSPIVETINRVYLTHINTPKEVVIAGDPTACQQVISTLQCPAVQAPYSHVIHCEPVRSEQQSFEQLNTIPLTGRVPCKLYFTAQNGSDAVTSQSVGQYIAAASTRQVDFPGLIQRAYNDGSRIFVELGPRSACTWWIADILREQPHLAVSINRSSQTDQSTLMKMLAQLASHRVSIDLTSLYIPPKKETTQPERSLVRTVSLLEKPIAEAILIPENRAKFSNVKSRTIAPQPAVAAPVTAPVVMAAIAPLPLPVRQPDHDPQVKIEQKVEKTPMPMNKPFTDVEEAKPHTTLPVEPPPTTPAGKPDLPSPSDFLTRQLEQLNENTTQASRVHTAFLHGRTVGLQQMSALIQQQLDAAGPLPVGAAAPVPELALQSPRTNNYSRPDHVIWNEADLLEFAEGKNRAGLWPGVRHYRHL
jgi:PfaB family protein